MMRNYYNFSRENLNLARNKSKERKSEKTEPGKKWRCKELENKSSKTSKAWKKTLGMRFSVLEIMT